MGWQDQPVAPEVVGTTSEGRPAFEKEGEVFSEKSITVNEEGINGGKATNIPTVDAQGNIMSQEEAVKAVIEAGGKDPITGRELPGFESIEEAEKAAKERSDNIKVVPKGKSWKDQPTTSDVELDTLVSDKEFLARVKQHEGFRNKVYKDSLGHDTIGYGHLLKPGEKYKTITEKQAEALLREDLKIAHDAAARLPVFEKLDPVRQQVLVEMTFNMGISDLKKFKRMLAQLDGKDYAGAAKEMRKSRWAKQVGKRAKLLANLMERGKEGLAPF